MSFFLQMKKIPVETIITVQKLSENETQSLCSKEHKMIHLAGVFVVEKATDSPICAWGRFSPPKTEMPVETTIEAKQPENKDKSSAIVRT